MIEELATVIGFVAAALLLILINGVFVAAEFAIVRVRRTRLEELAGEGRDAAKHAILLVDHVSEYLAVTQIGITAASLGVGWLGEDSFARLVGWLLPSGAAPSVTLHFVGIVVAFVLITTIHLLLGELVPKNLAIGRAEQLLLLLARPLQALHFALRPAIHLLAKVSSWILRLLGHATAVPAALTEEELKLVLMDSHEEGVVTRGEANIIVRAFEFADKEAAEIMIPAERVDFLSLSRTVEENLAVAKKHLRARLPLCHTGLDSVVGVVSMKDAWPLLESQKSNEAFERACRALIKIHPEAPQDDVLKLLQAGHTQMGVVRAPGDTRTLGIVTLEDVLESLIGDVREATLCPALEPPGHVKAKQ